MNGARLVTTIHDLPFGDFFPFSVLSPSFSPHSRPPVAPLFLFHSSYSLTVPGCLSTRQQSCDFSLDLACCTVVHATRSERARTVQGVKQLLPKKIMRGKIKFFSTRAFELCRPRDRAIPPFSRSSRSSRSSLLRCTFRSLLHHFISFASFRTAYDSHTVFDESSARESPNDRDLKHNLYLNSVSLKHLIRRKSS